MIQRPLKSRPLAAVRPLVSARPCFTGRSSGDMRPLAVRPL
ncbi:hypothetical protein [Streptomyces sp. 372A]